MKMKGRLQALNRPGQGKIKRGVGERKFEKNRFFQVGPESPGLRCRAPNNKNSKADVGSASKNEETVKAHPGIFFSGKIKRRPAQKHANA